MPSAAYDALIAGWRSLNCDEQPYVLPGDERILEKLKGRKLVHDYRDFDAYIADDDHGRCHKGVFHTGVLPDPFVGNLKSATIFILLGNPRFTCVDYYAESSSPSFREAKVRNIRQSNDADPYPLIYLDPQFCWHSASLYWQRKFSKILEKSKESYVKTLQILSKRVAVIECLPYHSVNMTHFSKLAGRLQSMKLIMNYVHNDLQVRARNKEILLLSLRGKWGLEKEEGNILVYTANEARAAHLTLSSRGGKKLAEFLEIF